MFSEFDRLAMTRALALAERGLETTHPNPRVGCVIAKDERIIAEGWHERAGEAHAEVAALRAAKEPVAGATAYVTLEPCSHYGRTPPCVNALIEARIARVVFAVQDPNPRVSGQGADALLRAGIAVEAGLMEAEATEINIGFMKRMKHGLPWVRVKLAMSLDGRTALANGASQWITGEHARNDVQRWRARCSAVMTGVGTVLADDPQLNVRTVGFKGRQPLRVVLDTWLRSPPGAKMFVGLGASAVASGGAVPGAADGDVLIFTAAGAGVPTANPVLSGALTEPADLAEDMAALVNALETSPTAAAARSADIAGPASMKTSANTDAPASAGASGTPPSGAAAKGTAGAAAGSPPDDATWAGAALSGAVPVGARQPKAPAVATGAPLSGPGRAGAAVHDPIGRRASPFPGGSAMPKPTIPVAPSSSAPAASSATPAEAAAAVAASTAPDDARAARASVAAGPNAALASEPTAVAPTAPLVSMAAVAGLRVVPASTSATGVASAPAALTRTRARMDSPAAFQARRAALVARGVRIEEVPADDGLLDLLTVLQKLAELDVNEVLVEAGPTLAGQLLSTFFVDELLLYIAPKLLGPQGRPLVNLPELQSLQDAWGFALFDAKRFGDDLRLRLRPK
jgi:riboflavin biosynthesis pyrimidine reductase/pyrimidine deaminase RibD-like protein